MLRMTIACEIVRLRREVRNVVPKPSRQAKSIRPCLDATIEGGTANDRKRLRPRRQQPPHNNGAHHGIPLCSLNASVRCGRQSGPDGVR